MNRRGFLRRIAALPLLPDRSSCALAPSGRAVGPTVSRVRPGQPGWPTPAQWDVGGQLIEVRSPLATCAQLFSYLKEADFFEPAWQESFWGPNYGRLLAIKDRYDPDGLFFVHHGVGSERWSPDGFTRKAAARAALA